MSKNDDATSSKQWDDLFDLMCSLSGTLDNASEFNDGLRVYTGKVDQCCRLAHKISLYDVYPTMLRDMYDDGVSPSEAADAVFNESLKWAHYDFGNGAYNAPVTAHALGEAHHASRVCAANGDRDGWNTAVLDAEKMYKEIGRSSPLSGS